jgi:molybdopterin-containing oxidoreductase family membrane subunit
MLASLVVCGLGLLWSGAIPDFASLRDKGGSKIYSKLAMGWQGTVRQWKMQRVLLSFLGAFYFIGIIWTHYVISSDFSMSLVPGWVDSIYPTFHALSGLQAALATMLLTAYVLRRFGGYKEYIPMETFWAMSKIFLATSMLWFYFWWSAFITYWYGRQIGEQHVLQLINFGPYIYAFVIAFLFCFVFAVFMLIWNPIRKNPGALASIALMVLIGCFFDRVRLFVSSWSVSDLRDQHHLHYVPDTVLPEAPDIMIIVGLISGAILVYMLASRLIPVMSIWEMRELRLYQRSRMLVRKKVMVLGKPE